jgi:PAS domain S-box-containing protein
MDTHDPALIGGERPTVSGGHPLTDVRGDNIFFAAIQTTRMPMIVTDPHQPDNPIVFANNAFVQMCGYKRVELVGHNCRFLQGPETDPESINEIRHAIHDRREIAIEILNYRKDGSTFWNALYISPVYDASGKLVYFFGSQLDVSRRRDAEEALRQSQKMEALGQLTGGIAHDFNNLLTITFGYVDLLKRHISGEDQPRLRRAVDAIHEASTRGATLTQQLLAFARKQRLEGRAVNLNSLVEQTSDLARRTLGSNIDIEVRLKADLWTSRLDPVQAEMALLNILINARDAMPDGGKVTIETENAHIEAGQMSSFGEMTPGRYATLSISDTGTGMPPEVLRRVMEPFFTTKEQGKGTGLGLSMVYGFMRQSGGAVHLYSEAGQGTTVKLYFPATTQLVEKQQQPAAARITADGAETILVVEDRPELAELAAMTLEGCGYSVVTAGNAHEALEIINSGGKFDLLFSDLIMPGNMNGVVLAREVRKCRPRIRVLLTTGYAERGMERPGAGASEFEVLNKPYGQNELIRRIREVLDAPTLGH